MRNAAISPSLMCADIFDLRRIIDGFESEGIEYLHIDVMDGQFVPNFCLGTDYCRRMKAGTDIPLDIHLMVTEPEKKLGAFPFGPGDIVSAHYESTPDVRAALEQIGERGATPFLAMLHGAFAVGALCGGAWFRGIHFNAFLQHLSAA